MYNETDLGNFIALSSHGEVILFTEVGNAMVHKIDLEDLRAQIEEEE